jgi:signal transduction histidine kinase
MEFWGAISKMGWLGSHDSHRRENPRGIASLRMFPILSMVAFIVFGGCQTANKTMDHAGPVIEFTSVPAAGAGDPNKQSSIRGRVFNAEPGQQIVLYAKGETTWWVQPFANQPFTKIERDSTWKSSTHPGTEYAALLVGAEFRPPLTTNVLPTQGVYATAITEGALPFWRQWWFPLVCVMGGVLVVFGLYQLRLYQLTQQMNLRFEERIAERTRVAQELHDTLLQGVISASMQLHVVVDQLPAESAAQPALGRILQLMGQVIEEGRNTLRGVRICGENPGQVEEAFLRMRQELGTDQKVNFRVIVEGSPRPLQTLVRDEIYSIGREAMVNAFRHSGAEDLEVELEYALNKMTVSIRDNGRGIDEGVLRSELEGHCGLSGMRERAERIGAKLRVLSAVSAGTEIELCIPGLVAFEPPRLDSRNLWLSKLYSKKIGEAKSVAGSEPHT